MKAVLFCNLPYAFSILKPLADVLSDRNIDLLWYINAKILSLFPYKNYPFTSDIKKVHQSRSDMIFVPGNQVPWYLRGVKVQVFHGLAGEKKGHFRIRDYFDLYLTQGPYFTQRFNELKNVHKNFEVVETGWPKLDSLYRKNPDIDAKRMQLLKESRAKHIILYAPTFSPSLTSTTALLNPLLKLSEQGDFLLIVKFHDKHNEQDRLNYQKAVSARFTLSSDNSINNLLKIADLMISDTSSAVYEFLLIDKPVITLKSQSEFIKWLDLNNPDDLVSETNKLFESGDNFRSSRQEVIDLYHPYSDGKSSQRIVDATLDHIKAYGIPKKRKISLRRKLQTIKKYDYFPWF